MAADFTDQVLVQCGFALGAGAGMKIKLNALKGLQEHLRPNFKNLLEGPIDPGNPDDPGPGAPRWELVDNFILGCCDSIGRLAAKMAIERGATAIDIDDLRDAFNKVSAANSGALPGEFCPDWPGGG